MSSPPKPEASGELKPCPRCQTPTRRSDVLPQENGWWHVLCADRCGIMLRVLTDFEEQAIAAWNYRTPLKPVSGEWISVATRLPEGGDLRCLIVYSIMTGKKRGELQVHPAFWINHTHSFRIGSPRGRSMQSKRISHWMPYPSLPKQEARDDNKA